MRVSVVLLDLKSSMCACVGSTVNLTSSACACVSSTVRFIVFDVCLCR